LHGSGRTHVSVRVDKREAWSLDRQSSATALSAKSNAVAIKDFNGL
jgi:hypothetical protein